MKSGALWVHCPGLSLTDFGRDLRSSEIWIARRIFCQVSNARFYRFIVGQISRNFNTPRRSVKRWMLSEQNFETFPARVRFSKKTQKFEILFNVLWLQEAITLQWLQIDGNLLPVSLYGMSSFHFYRWNQFKIIPTVCALCTRKLPQKFLASTPSPTRHHGMLQCLSDLSLLSLTRYSADRSIVCLTVSATVHCFSWRYALVRRTGTFFVLQVQI